MENKSCSRDTNENHNLLGDDMELQPVQRSASHSKMYQIVRSAMGLKNGNRSLSSTPASSNHNLTTVSVHPPMGKSPRSRRKMWAISAISGRRSSGNHNNNKLGASTKSADDSVEQITDNEVCLLSDGPMWIFKLAARGNLKAFSNFYEQYPHKLTSLDDKGATIIHHATEKNRKQIIEYVLRQPEGRELLDKTDDNDQTALHWAAVHNQPECVSFLINMGANPTILDFAGDSPLHKSIRCGHLEAFHAFLKHKSIININIRNAGGATSLHIAASIDCEDAAIALLESGGKPCLACNQGYRPIHEAALKGSKKVMEVLLRTCEKYGYTRAQMLSFSDKENCSPLHCAVSGGNPCAIRMCLEYGAKLDVRQEDYSTPLHLVCAQGVYDVIKIMFEVTPDEAKRAVNMEDKMLQTPLHKAAIFDHKCTIRFLARNGANLDIVDNENRTPLLLAASRESWFAMKALIELGADVRIRDKAGRNILHLVVMNGGDIGRLDQSKSNYYKTHFCDCGECEEKPTDINCWQQCEVRKMLDEADDCGCTPLHYACSKGNLASLRVLLTLGVSARMKSITKQSPLHFAAMYGRYNACVRLLNSQQGPNIINEKDDSGMSPLHFASLNGHLKVVQLFLTRGAVLHRDLNGATPLHSAALNGFTKTTRLLIEMNNNLLNQVDLHGNTALHVAAKAGHVSLVETLLDSGAEILRNNDGQTCFTEAITSQNREVAICIVQHNRWEEAMQEFEKTIHDEATNEENVKVPILLLIQHLPDVCLVAMDRCIEKADSEKKSEGYWIKYVFKYLQPSLDMREDLKRYFREKFRDQKKESKTSVSKLRYEFKKQFSRAVALPALNKMVEFNRVDCLRHPVSVAYLRMKWDGYGRLFHTMNLFLYLCVLIPLTYLVVNVDSSNHYPTIHSHMNGSNMTTFDSDLFADNFTTVGFIMAIILTSMCFCQIIKEFAQMMQQKTAYFLDFTNLMEWVLYTSSLLFVIPLFTHHPVHWQFEMGSVAVFLAWFNLLLFLQRFDLSGIYVVMFIEILRTLIQVVLVFSFLIVAFGLAFYVLMRNEESHAHKEPLISMLQVFVMTMGEIGYVERFLDPLVDGDPNTLHYAIPALLLLVLFFILMPILFMNLLIGLAVGDIAQIQSNAVLQRLAMQVQLHTDIEGKLPTNILRLVDHSQITIYPNDTKCGFWGKFFKAVSSRMQSDYGESPEVTDHNMTYVHTELHKQKLRIKEIKTTLDKQHDLLRLIVQKMEIRSEAEDQDEGWTPDGGAPHPMKHRFQHVVSGKVVAAKIAKAMSKK